MSKDPQGKKKAAAEVAPPPAGAAPAASGWLAMLAPHWAKVLAAGAVGLAAAIGVWLDPLKDAVLHQIYREQAEVALLLDASEPAPGAALTVRVRVTPTSKIDVAEGIVKLSFDPRYLSLTPGTADAFNAKRTSQARILDEGSFVLFVKNHKEAADTRLQATYTTKFGVHTSAEFPLKLPGQKDDGPVPYIERSGSKAINLSGEWRIQIGAAQGSMKIRQDACNDVAGDYAVTGNEAALLPAQGYKDGTSFKVFFWRDAKGSQRWFVDANFALNSQDPRFIEMKGCAYAIVQDAAMTRDSPVPPSDACARRDFVGWRGVGASTFYATAQMR